jgi:hypothetical protein
MGHDAIWSLPKLSGFLELQQGPEGSSPRRGRWDFTRGHRNGCMSLSDTPRLPQPEESHDLYCRRCLFGFILELLGALKELRYHLRRPLRGADSSGPFRLNPEQESLELGRAHNVVPAVRPAASEPKTSAMSAFSSSPSMVSFSRSVATDFSRMLRLPLKMSRARSY